MGASTYHELASHVGHTIECVYYGAKFENVALECVDCSTVLLDFDKEAVKSDYPGTTHCPVCGEPDNCGDCNHQGRLEYLRGQIRAECISYGELADLQSLAEYIDPDDVELLEWAGVPESDYMDGSHRRAHRLRQLKDMIETHGYDDSGLARLTPEERDEFVALGGGEAELHKEKE